MYIISLKTRFVNASYSVNIIQLIFQFVKMEISTIFQAKVCTISGKCKKIKKIQKTIDKQKLMWYNTQEVERTSKTKQNFRSHHTARAAMVNTFSSPWVGVVRAEILRMHFFVLGGTKLLNPTILRIYLSTRKSSFLR